MIAHQSRRCVPCAVLLAILITGWPARSEEEVSGSAPPDGHPVARTVPEELEQEITEESFQERKERRERMLQRPHFDPDRWTVEWRNGFHVVREDGRYELLLGVQTMFDGAVYHLDEALLPDEAGWERDWEVRRARFSAQGVLFTRLYFKVAYDVADTEVADLYVGLLSVGPTRAVQVGYMQMPFGLEESTSLQNLTFLEPSLANALTPKKQIGIMATGLLLEERVRWGFGGFLLDESTGQEDDTLEGMEDDWGLSLRVTATPIWEDEGRRLLLAGLSYAHVFNDGQDLELSVRPESRLVDALIESGSLVDVTGIDDAGLEFAWVDGPWSIQAEGIWSRISRNTLSAHQSWGAYVQGSWFLTGEWRTYGRASGVFGRVIPKRPFSPGEGDWGALELAGRVSYVDVQGAELGGGQQWNLTLGVNWYLRANVRVTANYIHGHVRGEGDMDAVQARLQFNF